MCGAVSFLLFIVDGPVHGQSIEHCVIALFSNYTYYTETKIIDDCKIKIV